MSDIDVELWHVLIASLLAPVVIEWVRSKLAARQEREKAKSAEAGKKPTVEAELRDELRDDIVRYRQQIVDLENLIDEHEQERKRLMRERKEALDELDRWKSAYYDVRRDKLSIEFEMKMLRKEVEILKAQLDIRNLTEQMINREQEGQA